MTGTQKLQQRNSVKGFRTDTTPVSEISAELQALGFSDYEARSYLALVKVSPSTAYDVSKTTGVPRANVYGAIENLVKKGAVQMVGQQPARFVPVPPKELMSNIAKSTSDRC